MCGCELATIKQYMLGICSVLYIYGYIYIHTGLKTLIWYNWIFIQKSLVTRNTLQALYAMCVQGCILAILLKEELGFLFLCSVCTLLTYNCQAENNPKQLDRNIL